MSHVPQDAAVAGGLVAKSRQNDGHLSFGDGLCIAAGIRLNLPVVCGDHEWETLDLPIKILPFR